MYITLPQATLSIAEITARKEALQRKLEIFVHNELSNFRRRIVSISVIFRFTTGG